MAVPALSTLAPVVRGGPVTRAVAVMRGAQPCTDESEGLGCIIIGGEPVFFDTGRYPAEGEAIVVVFGDGRIGVATMPGRHSHWRTAQTPNVLMIAADRPYAHGARVTGEEVTLIGVARR